MNTFFFKRIQKNITSALRRDIIALAHPILMARLDMQLTSFFAWRERERECERKTERKRERKRERERERERETERENKENTHADNHTYIHQTIPTYMIH